MAKIILGLGNPGSEYARTRHNVGFLVADVLARRWGIRIDERKNRCRLGQGRFGSTPVVVAKPQTYMNESGNAVISLIARFGAAPADLIVIYDDMNLPLGQVRVRASGSAGGHNGMKSIIGVLGTNQFPRVRIGIGAPKQGDAIDYVLGEFSAEERTAIEEAVVVAADAVEAILQEGADAAANRFNRKARPAEVPLDE